MNLPSKKCLWLAGVFLSFQAIATEQFTPGVDSFPIEQFLNSTSTTPIALVPAGRKQGIVEGATFIAYRKGKDLWVETGMLKALEVNDDYTLAQVTEEKSLLSSALFPKFSGVMAGDLLQEKKLFFSRVQVLTPAVTLYYHDLFVDPQAQPGSFELSEVGKEKLKEAAKVFAPLKLSTFIVEGHTDQSGNANANQVESYQRALTVRQFLATELKFDMQKMSAFGFGESEPLFPEFTPGYHEQNRRIVLKVISHNEESLVSRLQE